MCIFPLLQMGHATILFAMPILWRYLLYNYFKIHFLCLTSFIALLIVGRLKQIADLSACGVDLSVLARFILYQIPFILPIALPIASLVSGFLVFQRLSKSYEMTALRSQGISLTHICFPLLLAGALFSLTNFWIASEVETKIHHATRKLIYENTLVNPLFLLQNDKIAALNGSYIQMQSLERGKEAKNLFLAHLNEDSKRIFLVIAKNLHVKEDKLVGRDVTFLTHSENEGFDHLAIENQKNLHTKASDCATILYEKKLDVKNDFLSLKQLLIRIGILKKEKGEKTAKAIAKCYSEISRRFTLFIAPFTFTLLGCISGLEIGRTLSSKRSAILIGLASFAMISFFVVQKFLALFFLATTFFLLPHLLILFTAIVRLKKINRGLE